MTITGKQWLGAIALSLLLAGSTRLPVPERAVGWGARLAGAGRGTSVAVSTAPLGPPRACVGAFVAHTLPYSTDVAGDSVHLFDSNGSGVAISDLDGDAQLDLVFANLDGPNTVLWNEGDLTFTRQPLDDTDSRAVNSVDVDGDGRLDIVFTHRRGGVSYWRNDAARSSPRRFLQATLPGVQAPAYAMAWGDVGGDDALDLVTASYDADLQR
ncbi:MAG: VCBS repeat-containing protein, partial [Chloroflexota bacterium]|nr:VCBS repeat-containing protein [Chloroflexota bacterium]